MRDKQQRLKDLQKQNSYGLGSKIIENRKRIGKPLQQLLDDQQKLKESERQKSQLPDWINLKYVIVFIEDGAMLESCKSFKFNAKDIITKFDQDEE